MAMITIKSMPLTRLLVLGFGIVLIIGLGLILFLGVSGAEKNTRSLLTQLVQNTMSTVAEQIHGHLRPVDRQLNYLADFLATAPEVLDDSQRLKPVLKGALASTPQVLGLSFFGRNGHTIYVPRDGRNVMRDEWLSGPPPQIRRLLDNPPTGITWMEPTWSQRLGSSVIPVLVPVIDQNGLRGILAAPIAIESFSSFLTQLSTQVGMKVFILHGKGRVLAYPQLADHLAVELGAKRPLPKLSEVGDGALAQLWSENRRPSDWLNLQGISSHNLESEGTHQVYFYQQLDGYGESPWLVGAYLEQEGMLEEIRRLVIMVLVGGVMILLVACLVIWISRSVGNSLERIAGSFEAIGQQNLQTLLPLKGSRVLEFDQVSQAYNQMISTLKESARVQRLLGQYVPAEIAQQLLVREGALEPQQATATILFCDLEGFTRLSQQLGPDRLVAMLNEYFSAIVEVIEAHNGVVTQFQGDAVLATFNVPMTDPQHARQAWDSAVEIQQLMNERQFLGLSLRCRVGINTGSLIAGSVGAKERLNYTVHGDAVNLAARLEAQNKEYGTRILISEFTADQLNGVALKFVAETQVRGREGAVKLYTVDDT